MAGPEVCPRAAPVHDDPQVSDCNYCHFNYVVLLYCNGLRCGTYIVCPHNFRCAGVKEDKELLLKDLCSRLPYGVKLYCSQGTSIDRKKGWKLVGYHEADINIKDVFDITVGTLHRIILNCVGPNNNVDIDFIKDEVKPYLFPMSSMTEEQEKEYRYTLSAADTITYDTVDWCNKNHFDYRGLIPLGMAIDATNLNIY